MDKRAAQRAFALGSCIVRPAENRIELGGRTVHVEPKVMDVLTSLADRPGEVVGRPDLIDTVWGTDAGSDETLSRSISLLRRALSELGAEPMVATVPKRGYRLAAPVSPIEPQREASGAASRASPLSVVSRAPYTAIVAAIAIIAALALVGSMAPNLSNANRPSEVEASPTVVESPSLAVLPFTPFSDERADLHFSHGLSEELINSLVQIRELGVAARTSSFLYDKLQRDVRQIGKELGVDYLVEGSVRRDGALVRVTTQLVRTSDGLHVWSGVEEEEAENSFALQDEIVREVRRALELHLGVGYGGDLRPNRTVRPDAVALFYEGLHQVADGLREDGAAKSGYEALRAAVELEPNFAEAWVALAETGVQWADGPFAKEFGDFRERVRRDLEKALSLSPENYRAHIAAARFYGSMELDIDRAARHLAKAEALAPNSAQTFYARGWFSWLTGDVAAAFANYRQGLQLDPLNEQARFSLAAKRALVGETGDAFAFMRQCKRTNCLQEGFVAYATSLALMRGDASEKEWWAPVYADFERRLESLPASAKPDATKMMPAYAALGFGAPDAAEKIEEAAMLFDEAPITNHIGMWGPTLATVLDRERFLDAVVATYEQGGLLSHGLAMSPYYGANPYPDWLLTHPRYHELWERPELARLAELRRANGWHDGLPARR